MLRTVNSISLLYSYVCTLTYQDAYLILLVGHFDLPFSIMVGHMVVMFEFCPVTTAWSWGATVINKQIF